MKGNKFLAILGIFSLAVLSFGLAAIGATSASVTASVTPQNISVTVTDGTVSYGTLDLNTSKNTVGADTQTATNNGNVSEKFYTSSSDAISSTAGTNWNLEATTGANQYVHQFSTNSGVSYTNFPADNSNAVLAASVSVSGSQTFDLNTTTPTSTTGYEQRNITVTVLATAL